VAERRFWSAVRLGLAGGLAAGALVMLGGLAAAGAVPPRLLAAAFLVALAGVAVSLLATGLSAIWSRLRPLDGRWPGLTVHRPFARFSCMALEPT